MEDILIKNLLIKGQPKEESSPRAPESLKYKELATDIAGHVYIGDKNGNPQKVGNDEALTMSLEEGDPVIVKTNADLLQGRPAEDFVLKEDKGAIITTFTHSKSGNVHNFIGEGENGRALLTANIEEGDIFAVNGQNVSAFMGSEQASKVMADGQWSGKRITFTIGEGELVFNGGDSRITKNGVSVYTHSKEGTTHNFQGTGPNGRALMTANVEEGDTFTVNGTPVTAWMGTDEAVGSMAGSEYNGRWVSFIVDGDTLNFKGGGGRVTVEGLTADKVNAGTTVVVKQGQKVIKEIQGTVNGYFVYFTNSGCKASFSGKVGNDINNAASGGVAQPGANFGNRDAFSVRGSIVCPIDGVITIFGGWSGGYIYINGVNKGSGAEIHAGDVIGGYMTGGAGGLGIAALITPK